MANIVDRLFEEHKVELENYIIRQGDQGGTNPVDVAMDAAIDVFSDIGFSVEDSEDGDTGKLFAKLEEHALQFAKTKVGQIQ